MVKIVLMLLLLVTGGFIFPPTVQSDTALYYWFNHDQKKYLWPSIDEFAIFKPLDAPWVAHLKSDFKAGIQVVQQTGGMQLWKVKQVQLFIDRIAALPNDQVVTLSAVYYENPRLRGRRFAFPGGVMVIFHSQLTVDQLGIWVKNQNVKMESSLAWEPKGVLLQSPPGEASLNLANRLKLLPEVAVSFPNLWYEVHKR